MSNIPGNEPIDEVIVGRTAEAVLQGIAAGAAVERYVTAMTGPGVMTLTSKRIHPAGMFLAIIGVLGAVLIAVAGGVTGGILVLLLLLGLFIKTSDTVSVIVRDADGGARVTASGSATPKVWATLREMLSAMRS